MSAERNGRVTTRDLLVAIHDLRSQVEEYHLEISKEISALGVKVERSAQDIEKHDQAIDDLQKSDRRWSAFTGALSAAIAAIVAWLFNK